MSHNQSIYDPRPYRTLSPKDLWSNSFLTTYMITTWMSVTKLG